MSADPHEPAWDNYYPWTYEQFLALYGRDAPVRVKIGDEPVRTMSRAEFETLMGKLRYVDPLEEVFELTSRATPLTPEEHELIDRILADEFESRPCDGDENWDPEALEVSSRATAELSLANMQFVCGHPSFPHGCGTVTGDAIKVSLGLSFGVGKYRAEWDAEGTPYERHFEILPASDHQSASTCAWLDYARAGGERESALFRLAKHWANGKRCKRELLSPARIFRWRQRAKMNDQEARQYLLLTGIMLALGEMDAPLSPKWRIHRPFAGLDQDEVVTCARELRSADYERFAAWLRCRALQAARVEASAEMFVLSGVERRAPNGAHANMQAEVIQVGKAAGVRRSRRRRCEPPVLVPLTRAVIDKLPTQEEDSREPHVDAQRKLDEVIIPEVSRRQRELLSAWRELLRRDSLAKVEDAGHVLGMSPSTARRHLQMIRQGLGVAMPHTRAAGHVRNRRSRLQLAGDPSGLFTSG